MKFKQEKKMIFKNKEKIISFDDVILIPQYSELKTRSSIDTSVLLKHGKDQEIKLSIPIISSPMSTITEAHMCNSMRSIGGLGIIHRYNTIQYHA